jgi:hypothetical protein
MIGERLQDMTPKAANRTLLNRDEYLVLALIPPARSEFVRAIA